MRRGSVIVLAVLLSGCSTAPVADLLDWVHPGKLEQGPFHGGVEATPTIALPTAPQAPPAVVPVVPPAGPPTAIAPPPASPQWPTAPTAPAPSPAVPGAGSY